MNYFGISSADMSIAKLLGAVEIIGNGGKCIIHNNGNHEYEEFIYNDECGGDCCITKEDLEMVNEFPVRLQEWCNFSDDVEEHIQEYTIPQYGDYPQDQLTTTTNECIIHDMKRYLNRFGKGQRGYKEAMRDMLKIAQYAGVLYNRLQQEFNPSKSPFIPKQHIERGVSYDG